MLCAHDQNWIECGVCLSGCTCTTCRQMRAKGNWRVRVAIPIPAEFVAFDLPCLADLSDEDAEELRKILSMIPAFQLMPDADTAGMLRLLDEGA